MCALGDPITDLTEDMAAEQKARTTYEHLIACTCDPLNDVQEWMRHSKHMWPGQRPEENRERKEAARPLGDCR